MELVAGGIAAGLFGYNRKNFMFDKTQQIKRTYFGQNMKIKRYELYREDIHDLTELTVSKMDVYLVINVLQLLFCMMLFTEGMPKPGKTPMWLHWLFAASSGTAVLYFVLSIWLGMHASIAAHSFGVRMLTQFVRLPVPNTKQIHSAASRATDYEASSVTQMLRVPVLQQQLRNLNAAMGETSQSADQVDTTGHTENFLPEASAPRASETGTLAHIQLYRQLQANWQAYDAYSRVCMAMGTNQLLQAMCDYCLGVLLSETKSGWASVCCIAVIAYVAFLIARLDLLVTRRVLVLVGVMQIAAPLLTLACLYAHEFPHSHWRHHADRFVPLIFLLNIAWIACVIQLAKGEGDSVALPAKFRGVLYLDVFGWLSPQANSGQTDSGGAAASPSPEASDGQQVVQAPAEALPVAVHISLAELCARLKGELELQVLKWECEGLAAVVYEDKLVLSEVANVRREFDAAAAELERASPAAVASQATGTPESSPTVWLKLEWNTSGRSMEYFWDPDSGQTLWTQPAAPDRVSDLQALHEQVATLAEKVKALRILLAEEQNRELQERRQRELEEQLAASSQPGDPSAASSGGAGASAEEDAAAAAGAAASSSFRGASPSASGGSQSFFGSSAFASTTFHPHAPAEQEGGDGEADPPLNRRPPGHLPWTTFYQGSMALIGIWVLGTFWCIGRVYFGIKIPIRPAPGLSRLWTKHARSEQLELELIHNGPWPHAFFGPKGLACSSAMGAHRILVAEAHAVHELDLSQGNRSIWHWSQKAKEPTWRPALQGCLAKAPHVVASGIRDIVLQCPSGASRVEHGHVGPRCNAVLLAAGGRRLLTCQLHGTPENATEIQLFGGPWQAVAASAAEGSAGLGSLWAKAPQATALVRLGSQLRRAVGLAQDGAMLSGEPLVPLLEVSLGTEGGGQQAEHLLALEDGSAVLALEPSGRLWVHSLRAAAATEPALLLQLPQGKGARWAGVCSPGGRELLLVGRSHGNDRFAIWRSNLPSWLP